MLITRKELDYYRNNDKEIEMHMEKLKRWQLILLRVENSYGIALRSVPEGADVINEIKAILNATSAYLDILISTMSLLYSMSLIRTSRPASTAS